MKDDKILHDWINGNLSKEELEAFKLRPEYPSLVELYKNTENWVTPDFDKEKMLSGILEQEKKTINPNTTARRFHLSNWVKYGVAASLLLFATWILWPKENLVRYDIAQGETMKGTLPDQSSFMINAESSLSYLSDKWENNRRVNIEGEVFFKVQKGETFEVYSSNGKVKVLGTQFNVFSRNGVLEVKCTSGKVAVYSSKNKILTELIKGKAVRVVKNEIEENWEFEADNQKDWRDGIFRFKKAPLSNVISELERQFEIKINSKNLDLQEILNCNFQNKDLESALKTTVGTLGIQFEIKDDTTVLIYK